MLFQKHFTIAGQYCGFVLSAQADLAAQPIIKLISVTKRTGRQQNRQADRRAKAQ